jgi:hypothetical protein
VLDLWKLFSVWLERELSSALLQMLILLAENRRKKPGFHHSTTWLPPCPEVGSDKAAPIHASSIIPLGRDYDINATSPDNMHGVWKEAVRVFLPRRADLLNAQ